MGNSPEIPPEAQRFDEFVELSTDGNPVFRIEQVSEVRLSELDSAAIGLLLKGFMQEIEEDLQDQYDMGIEELLEEEQPDVEVIASGETAWDSLID